MLSERETPELRRVARRRRAAACAGRLPLGPRADPRQPAPLRHRRGLRGAGGARRRRRAARCRRSWATCCCRSSSTPSWPRKPASSRWRTCSSGLAHEAGPAPPARLRRRQAGDRRARSSQQWDELKRQRARRGRAPPWPACRPRCPRWPTPRRCCAARRRRASPGPTAKTCSKSWTKNCASWPSAATPEDAAAELGDLLLNVANYARYLGIDAEEALREAGHKFRRRFAAVESQRPRPRPRHEVAVPRGADGAVGRSQGRRVLTADAERISRIGVSRPLLAHTSGRRRFHSLALAPPRRRQQPLSVDGEGCAAAGVR